jgi:hypothetical protein
VVEGFRIHPLIAKSCKDHVDLHTQNSVFHNYLSFYLSQLNAMRNLADLWCVGQMGWYIGTTILTGFHRSCKQITVFVMAKELAARCFATKPKRTTNSCRTSSWFTEKTSIVIVEYRLCVWKDAVFIVMLLYCDTNWSRYLSHLAQACPANWRHRFWALITSAAIWGSFTTSVPTLNNSI